MIKVQKGTEPQILQTNKSRWTTDLLGLVHRYHSYDKIPQKEKDSATKFYRHPDIQAALKNCNGLAKCVYCESLIDLTSPCSIEHYYPKSLYPNRTFEWENLFTCCSLCNTAKGDFDTGKQPFVHPVIDNPEDYLTFRNIMYVPKSTTGVEHQKAQNVIDQCNLQRRPLIYEHSQILIAFVGCCDAIKENLEKFSSHQRESCRISDLSKILSTLCGLKKEASNDAKYSGFMRYLLRDYEVIRNAVALVNQHKSELGLIDDFDWGFDF